MQKLNICLVSLAFAPDKERSGFEGIFDYLKKQGHNVKLITGKWNIELKDPDIIQVDIIRKRFLWVPQFIFKVVKYIRSHEFDIIHGNGPKGTLPIILSNKKNFITTIHDLGPFESKFTKIPLEQLIFKLAVKKAKYIITVSNSSKNGIKHFIPRVNINKIFKIYNGINDKFKPYPKKARELKNTLNIEGPVVLYLGRIANYKGVEDIIQAYRIVKKKISNLNLLIAGKPDFKMEKEYLKWKKQYKDIYFLGYIPEEDVPIYYSLADIFINYSFAAEGFGFTPLEALACGTPVICSALTPFKEVLQDNAIFLPPKSPKLLAIEIENLIEDKNKRIELVENSQYLLKKYTWDSVGQKLEKIYTKLLSD